MLPVPAFALQLLYGDMAQIVTTGQRVLPARLEQLGYPFRYPDLEAALRDVLATSIAAGPIDPRPSAPFTQLERTCSCSATNVSCFVAGCGPSVPVPSATSPTVVGQSA